LLLCREQANQRKLFKDIVQFDPNDLQGGGGSGVGLWSKFHFEKLPHYFMNNPSLLYYTLLLPVSQAIVDLHGGTLGVESTPGKGSMFYIQMPVGRLALEGKDKFSSLSNRSRVPSSVDETLSVHSTYCQFESEAMAIAIRAFRVCVADDSSLNRKMLNKILSLEVDKVVLCSDGLQCTEVIKESMTSGGNKVDMVIMDVEMPIANGVEATKLIRSMGYKGVVVFLTGNAQPEMRVKCLRSGGDLVIIKPCTVADIKNALECKCEYRII
jgi:CheY-like chemotaxis protein